MAGASSVFPNRLAPPLGMGYTTRRKQTAAPGEWPAGKGVFMRVLEQLEPQGVFRFFEELCAIPHGSRNCQAVSDWCADTLSKYDEIPQKEIARIMEISEGAVEQLLQRAKINLQKKLKQP